MKKYSLIFIFGHKAYRNDQILLVSKKEGLKKGLWNGLGKQTDAPERSVINLLVELQISISKCTISKAAVLAYPHAQVYIYSVFLNYDLVKIVNRLDNVNNYWIADTKMIPKRAFIGKEGYSIDLAYLIPLAMDPDINTTIIINDHPQEKITEAIQKIIL